MGIADDIINGKYQSGTSAYKKKKKKDESIADQIINRTYEDGLAAPTSIKTGFSDDIAPVKKEEEKDTWFSKGAFEDGYDFGDITKTILGTTGDIVTGAAKGIFNIGEGLGDLASYGIAGVVDLFGNDEYADKIRKNAATSVADKVFKPAENFLDPLSVVGEKGDSVSEGLGYVGAILATGGVGSAAGLGTLGTTALTSGLTGFSSMGSGMGEAYQGGATDGEALMYGVISGVAEAGSELIFGGLGKAVNAVGISKGLSSLDDALAKKISSKLTSTLSKNLAEYTVKAGAEGVEEVISGIAQGIGKKMTYMSDEDLVQILKDEKLLDQFISGAVVSGIAQAPGLVKTTSEGQPFISENTQDNQAQAEGLQQEIAKKTEEYNKSQDEREKQIIQETINGLNEELNELTNAQQITDESELRKQHFTYETQENDSEYKRRVYESAAKHFDNTETTHKFIDAIANIAEERGTIYEFTNTEEIKQGNHNVGDNIIDGFVQDGKVKINVDSPKFLNVILGHETTHLLENKDKNTGEYSKEYKALKQVAIEYAKSKGDYDARIEKLTKLYEGTNADIEAELTSDIVGEYLFTDYNFVKELSVKQPTIFEKIKNFISDLVVKFKGTDQEKQLRQLQRTFEKAYKAQGTQTTDTKYSMNEKAVQGLENYSRDEIKQKVTDYINTELEIYDNYSYGLGKDAEIVGLEIIGSRNRGNAKKRSDLDIVVEFKGDSLREDSLFNALNDYKRQLKIDGIRVDINPIVSHESGTLAEYMESSNAYDKEILSKQATTDNQGRTLTKEQQEYFKDSKVRDRNGRLIEVYHGTTEEFTTFYDGSFFTDDYMNADGYASGEIVMPVYLNLKNPLIIDCKGMKWDNLETPYGTSTQEIVGNVDDTKYDGVIFENINDNWYDDEEGDTGTVYYTFHANQIKNVDNTNPTTDPDIRYSLSEDNQGNEIKPNVQKWAENSKARDEDGNLKVLYHGTATGEFTVFDKSKANAEGDWGRGFYFTDSEYDVEINYEDGGADFDNKIARLAEQIEQEEDISYEEAEGKAREQLYKGGHKFEVYLNIEKPAIVGETRVFNYDDYADDINADLEAEAENYKDEIKERAKELYIESYGLDDSETVADYKMTDELEEAKNEILDNYGIRQEIEEKYISDDIDSAIWAIEREYDFYNGTDQIRDLLYEAFFDGGIEIEDLKERLNDLYLETDDGMVGYDVARIILESLGYDGIIDPTVSTKWNLDMDPETTHYIVFKPNQIKAITNENPTSNPDINLSLSAQNEEIAPTGQWNVRGEDIKLQVEAALSPLQETISNLTEQVKTMQESFAPTSQDIVEQQGQEAFNTLTDEQAPKVDVNNMSWEDAMFEIMDKGDFEYSSTEHIPSPLDSRDIEEVGNRKVKAYQYENPEVKPYFQAEAEMMLYDLDNTIKGEKGATRDALGNLEYYGITRQTTEAIAYLKNLKYNYSYDDIRKGLNAIIEDDGKENNAISKRIEFLLDERLREGYTTSDGFPIPPNQDYINFLNEKQVTEYNKEAFNALSDADVPLEQATMGVEPELKVSEQITPQQTKTAQNGNTGVEEAKQRSWAKTSTESDVVKGKILLNDLDAEKIQYVPITNKATLAEANETLESLGYEEALDQFYGKIKSGQLLKPVDVTLGQRLMQESLAKGDKATAIEILQDIAMLDTELGQIIQATSIIQRMTPAGQLRMLEKTVKRGKLRGDKAFKGLKLTEDMQNRIMDCYNEDGVTHNQDKLNEVMEQIKQELADQMPVTTMEKINAWRYLSMLGNPKTHGRNIISNVANIATIEVKNAMARTIEDLSPIENRTKTWKPASQEIKDFAKQTATEMKDIILGENQVGIKAEIKSKRKIFKGFLEKLTNGNSNVMTTEDWWFSGYSFKKSLQEFLTANGIKTQQDIQNNPELVEKGKQYALEQSQIATFRQYSWLASKINEFERKNAATQIAVGSVLPFKKTPINIAKAGLNYSLLGFAKTPYDIIQVKKGNMEASQLIDNIAQHTTGTALTLVGYMLAQMGFLNGAGDDDKEGKYDYQLGKQGYSINIDGSTYSLSWLSPIAMPLLVGANAFEKLVKKEEWNPDVVMDTLAQTLDPLSEMSFLSSLDDVMSSYDSGIMKFASIGQTAIQNYTTQFIPTLSSQVAATLDDTKRTTKVSGDNTFKQGEELYNQLIYKIPGLRETLEPSTDIWGNEVKQSENLFTRAFENFIAPYARKESIATEIDNELKDLYSQTGDNGLLPSIPYNYVNYDGEKYNMSAEEYTDYKKAYGQTANDLLEDLFRTTTYKNATSEERADMVNDVYDYARDEAKLDYLGKEGVDYTNATKEGEEYYKVNDIKGAIDNDMTVDEYRLYSEKPEKYNFFKNNGISYSDYEGNKDLYNYAYEHQDKYAASKAITGDFETYYSHIETMGDFDAKDEYGNSVNGLKKERVFNYVNSLDLDEIQKAIMFKMQYPKDDDYVGNGYNDAIVQYVSGLDMTYEEMVQVIEGLGMTVDDEGNVYWE